MSLCASKLPRFRILPTNDPQTLVCELSVEHHGYCWQGVQPWPHPDRPRQDMARKAYSLVSCWLRTNDEVGIRAYGGFCRSRWQGKDCMLKWKHKGPHAAPGLLWVDETSEEDDLLGALDIVSS